MLGGRGHRDSGREGKRKLCIHLTTGFVVDYFLLFPSTSPWTFVCQRDTNVEGEGGQHRGRCVRQLASYNASSEVAGLARCGCQTLSKTIYFSAVNHVVSTLDLSGSIRTEIFRVSQFKSTSVFDLSTRLPGASRPAAQCPTSGRGRLVR
jgi:hypothetical protein